ncbi:histamine H3 receptor-like [Anneissia japonica]|uniref:histamine H3 receptor-like n=1 Tax=Anneissia japonica TaxID=1529436 RepID=UPI00142558D9|nr:histamine H3 receptor-like [Anneissia japonica]
MEAQTLNATPSSIDDIFPLNISLTAFVFLWLMSFLTICGNVFVILAWIFNEKIHSKAANTFILNLSIADLFVGLFSLPLNNISLYYGYWPFGWLTCQLWSIIDYTACLQAVFMIIMISLDRYWLVKKGLKYKTFQTNRRTLAMTLTCWVFSLTFYSFSTFVWPLLAPDNSTDIYHDGHEGSDCELEMLGYLPFDIVLISIEFYIPLVFLVYFNSVVYVNIRGRSRMNRVFPIRKSPKPISTTKVQQRNELLEGSNLNTPSMISNPFLIITTHGETTVPKNTERLEQIQVEKVLIDNNNAMETLMQDPVIQYCATPKKLVTSSTKPILVRNSGSEQRSSHRKAFVMLTSLVCVFVICWMPYNVVLLMDITYQCYNESTWEAVNILLWSNSLLNPFLYAATNTHFRAYFTSIFCRVKYHHNSPPSILIGV